MLLKRKADIYDSDSDTDSSSKSQQGNRIKFEKLSRRLQKIKVDVLHVIPSLVPKQEVKNGFNLNRSSIGGDSLIREELEIQKQLETLQNRHFKEFYFSLEPLVQSLPEILFHKKSICQIFIKSIQSAPAITLGTYFTLLGTLTKDIGEELSSNYEELLQALVSVCTSVAYSGNSGSRSLNPELTGHLFQCISYILKGQISRLKSNPEPLVTFYGLTLGHSLSFVREYAAKSFSICLMKLSDSKFVKHFSKVLFSASRHHKSFYPSEDNMETDFLSAAKLITLEDDPSQQQHDAVREKRVDDLMHGLSLLLFYTMKGVKNRIHSTGTSTVLLY